MTGVLTKKKKRGGGFGHRDRDTQGEGHLMTAASQGTVRTDGYN